MENFYKSSNNEDRYKARIQYLKNMIAKKEKSLESAPPGFIKVLKRGNNFSYYYKENWKDEKWKCIKKSEKRLIKPLMQKSYDRLLLKAARSELKKLELIRKANALDSVDDVYHKLPAAFKDLISPAPDTRESVFRQWKTQKFIPKPVSNSLSDIQSKLGERMRSKSEVIIADMLTDHNIPYIYEKPLNLKGYGTIYPDFTLYDVINNYEIYWEHMGLLDDPEYRSHAFAKIATYEKNGLLSGNRLIITFESEEHPLNMEVIKMQVEMLYARTSYFNI